MASIKYILQGKSGETSIYLRLSLGRKKDYKRKTGLSINVKNWSVDKSLPKQNLASNKQITSKLKALESKIYEDLNDAQSNDVLINGDWLQFRIDLFFERTTESKVSDLLIDAIQDVIDNAGMRKNSKGEIGLSKSRINSYKVLKRVIEAYSGKKQYRVKDVNVKFANSFITWLLEKEKYGKSTALKKMDDLKSVCHNAEINGITVNSQLSKIKGSTVKKDNIIYLSFQELEIIQKTELENEALINTRKWLMLGCNIGQRGGDLLKITEDNFSKIGNVEVIELIQQKTNKKVLIPLNQEVKLIYESGLPYEVSTQKFNEHLKKLCGIAEINTPTYGGKVTVLPNKKIRTIFDTYPKHDLISSHVCRRSFASNFYGKMPTNLIMQITGHSTEKMLLTYIGKKATDHLQEIANYFSIEEQKQKKESNLYTVKQGSNQ